MGRTIKLNAVRHPAPAHPDYTDLDQVTAFERSVRVHRAHQEAFEVMSAEGRVDSTWQARGESGETYHVDLVDRSGLHDVCDCPDFLSNQLGTCKHLEAVRRAVGSRKDLAAAFARLPLEPVVPTLGTRMGEDLGLAALGPWTRQLGEQVGLKVSAREPRRVAGRPWARAGPPHPPRGETKSGSPTEPQPCPCASTSAPRCTSAGRASSPPWPRSAWGWMCCAHPSSPTRKPASGTSSPRGRALLSDDMGLGKTVQAIAACEVLRRRGEARTILVVTPASLKDQWAREIERHAGARAVVLGKGMEGRTAALNSDAPYKILNYELTHRELSRLKELDADVLILDEAQRAKNFRTRTATTLRAIPSRFLFVLTGTPVENRLDDLYALLQLADPEVMGPLWRFNFDFHIQNPKGPRHRLPQPVPTPGPGRLCGAAPPEGGSPGPAPGHHRADPLHGAFQGTAGAGGFPPELRSPTAGHRRAQGPHPGATETTPGRPAQGAPSLQCPGALRPHAQEAGVAETG